MEKKLLLKSIGDDPVACVLTDCKAHILQLSKLTGIPLQPDTATGNEVLNALNTLSEEEQVRFLATTPEPKFRQGIDAAELGAVIAHLRKGQSVWKTAVAVFMALLVGVVVVDYAIMMYIATVNQLTLPVVWQDITFIIIIPGGIVWAWFGVLSRENRELLKATLGEVSLPGPVGAIVNAIIKRKEAPGKTPESSSYESHATPPPRQSKPRYEPSMGSDETDDNPPPGAAR